MNLLRRKSVTQLQADALTDNRLKRALGATNLTALGIGAIIGTGIFVLTGTVAAQNAGPAVGLTFLVPGVASSFAALCYIEFRALVFIIGAAHAVNPANWHPFIPPSTGARGHFGWSGVMQGAGIVFFAYIGFDAVSTAAQEAKNPQHDMPIGIIGSLLICTVLYIAVSALATGIVPYPQLDVPDPIAVAADHAGLGWMSAAIKLGAIAGLSSVILVMLLGQSRIFWTMADDGLLPPFVSKVHPKFRTPWITTIVTGVVVAFFAALFTVREAGSLVSIGTLLAFVIVSIGVLVLRIREPDLPRTFKTPAVWIVAPLGALSALYLMVSLPRRPWVRLIIWFVIGMLVYFFYGVRRSKLAQPRV